MFFVWKYHPFAVKCILLWPTAFLCAPHSAAVNVSSELTFKLSNVWNMKSLSSPADPFLFYFMALPEEILVHQMSSICRLCNKVAFYATYHLWGKGAAWNENWKRKTDLLGLDLTIFPCEEKKAFFGLFWKCIKRVHEKFSSTATEKYSYFEKTFILKSWVFDFIQMAKFEENNFQLKVLDVFFWPLSWFFKCLMHNLTPRALRLNFIDTYVSNLMLF